MVSPSAQFGNIAIDSIDLLTSSQSCCVGQTRFVSAGQELG